MSIIMAKITLAGLKEIEEKLEYLKTVRRQEISQQIKEARAFGDLSENAEYDEAKNEQARIEGEIANLEKMLKTAEIVSEDDMNSDTVNIGSKVKLLDVEFNEEDEYMIVGSAETNVALNKISNESPVGMALMGKKKDEVVNVETPSGVIQYKILDIYR